VPGSHDGGAAVRQLRPLRDVGDQRDGVRHGDVQGLQEPAALVATRTNRRGQTAGLQPSES